jgi:Protein of unknown function (DUF4236)
MPLRFRKCLRLGPFRWYVNGWRITSWGIALGRWTWNARSRRSTVNLPGPFYWTHQHRGRRS